MRAAVGVESEVYVNDVEKGAIIKFAQAIGDTNPIYNDEEAARQSRYGGIVAPPTFFRSLHSGAMKVDVSSPYTANLDGGSEWEYYEPVRPGDRIAVSTKISNIFEQPGTPGQYAVHTARNEVCKPVRHNGRDPEDHRDQLPAVG